jgi:predicted ATP-grasp superfamily ATP-dependent carboligase
MDRVTWERTAQLRSPTMVCSFKGWNDAAESASSALRFLATQWAAERIGAIDPEDFFDFQVTRPTVKLTEGLTREIEWPEFEFSSARPAGSERDLVFLVGNEPNLHWKTFAGTVVGAAQELGVTQVVSLGALLADVPHTRPVQVTGIAGDPGMAERLGFSETRYEGPTGIVGVLHDFCAKAGLESASLWAPVPHYVAAVPSPKASLALIQRLEGLLGVPIDASGLEEASGEYERRLDEAVAAEPEVRALVERLEQQMDESEISFGDLPSGDSIAREFQRFLRDQGTGGQNE